MFGFEKYTPIFDETEFEDDKYKQEKPKYVKPTKMERTTATILSSFNQVVNIDLLYNFLDHRDIKVTKCDDVYKQMFNQITAVISVITSKGLTRNINTKIYRNGSIHMTGGYSIKEVKKAIGLLLECMKKIKVKVKLVGKLKDEIDDVPKYVYCMNDMSMTIDEMEFKYRMSNRPFKTNFSYCLGTLYKLMKEEGEDVKYNPNVYPGICWRKTIDGSPLTFLLFKSGKTTLSLGEDTSIATSAYVFVNKIFKKYYDKLYKEQYKIDELVNDK